MLMCYVGERSSAPCSMILCRVIDACVEGRSLPAVRLEDRADTPARLASSGDGPFGKQVWRHGQAAQRRAHSAG